jgi:hypothetical protein
MKVRLELQRYENNKYLLQCTNGEYTIYNIEMIARMLDIKAEIIRDKLKEYKAIRKKKNDIFYFKNYTNANNFIDQVNLLLKLSNELL